MTKFQVTDWEQEFAKATASDSKEPIYRFLRPLLDLIHRRQLTNETLLQFKPDLVLGERGFPLVTRRRWATNGTDLQGKTILVQGTGNGWDLFSWASFNPKKLIGVDLFEFESWPDIQNRINTQFGVEAEFHCSPLDKLEFIDNESIDLCVSDAVYEHIKNLDEVLRETHRVLKLDGVVCALYGPLWYCAGGDHFSGRGGYQNSFNHVLLEANEYNEYFSSNKSEKEDFQAGGRYVELDLFSKLKTEEYIKLFNESGFFVDGLIFELSSQALRFRRGFPNLFNKLLEKNPTCRIDDFIIKANFVRLKKLCIKSEISD